MKNKSLVIILIFLLIANPLMALAEPLEISNQTTESDYIEPTLNNVQLSTRDVNVGEEIVFTASVSDDLSGVSSVSAMIYIADRSKPDGARYIEFVYDPETTNWIGTYIVGVNDQPGEWILQDIHMVDSSYNSNWAYISESFTIHNADGDFSAPIVENVVIDPETANVGDVVNFSMKVTDDKSDISYVNPYLQSVDGMSNRYIYVEYDQEKDAWVGSFTVQKNDRPGLWTLMVDTQDTAGNYGMIDTNKNLYINNEDGDFTAPVIENIEVSPSTIAVGETITITADVNDDHSGIREVTANLHSYNYEQYETVKMNYNQELNKWIGTFTAKDTTQDGDWFITVNAVDNFDNHVSNYSSPYFNVINPDGDYTAPTITSLEVNPTNITVGEQVTLTATVEDDKSGVAYVQVQMDYIGNVPFKYNSESGKWIATVTIPNSIEDGTILNIHSVEAIDFKGNKGYESFYESVNVSNPTPLTLKNVEFSSNTVKVGDDLQIQAKFANDQDVVKSVTARITNEYSLHRLVELTYDQASGTWIGTYPVTAKTGEWYVYLDVKDVQGNSYYFSADKTFTIENPDADIELPVIENVTITPDVATLGDEIMIEVEATDIGSDIEFVHAFLKMEDNYYHYIPLTLDQTTKKWIGKYTVRQNDVSGLWTVEITASDFEGNMQSDSNYQIEINNPNADITAPTIKSFHVDRIVAQPGETVKFEAKIIDNESGVSEAYVQISQNNSSESIQKQVKLSYEETRDLWVGSYTIPAYSTSGLHYVYLTTVDQAGNYNNESWFNDLLILNDTPDYDKPILGELSFTPGTVKLGDSVSFKVKATDVGSGVEDVSVTFMDGQYWNASEFGGYFESIDLEYDSTENVWIGSKVINSVDYTGKWRLEVSARDGAGNYVYDTFPQPLYVDRDEVGTVTSVDVEVNQTSPQVVGTPITVKATSEGSKHPEYRFLVRDEKGDITTIQEYSSQDTITWTPTQSGDYTIIVHAKDKNKTGSASFYEAMNEMNYKINVGKVTSVEVEADQASPQRVGTPITLTATSEGSNEPLYRFLVKGEKGKPTTLQSYSSNDTVTWTPTSPGNYTITVYGKDKNKPGLGAYEAQAVMSYEVNADKVTSVNVTAEQSAPQVVGTPITLKATSEGSNEPLYRFSIKDNKGTVTTLKSYSGSDTVTWTPTSIGNYKIIVYGKDKNSSDSEEYFEEQAVMNYKVKAGKITSVNVTAQQSAPQMAGTPITLKATSEGSNEPLYRFLIKDDKGTVTTLQTYNSNDTVTWTPTSAGNYTIIVHGKDKNKPGSEESSQAQAEMLFTVQ
ncbi:triple tyrosine motif-containing protein [Niallia sp. XMNu-256]|uniref:triple tyrosine motif-containing protein n=1 Tax=Niallia sp. XMNu-256 TaxID=3082444 RepID=UPI0030D4CC9D